MSQPPPDRARCEVCGKAQEARFKPFCSKRCADVDLGQWLGGRYSIPAEEEPEGLGSARDDEE
jgi:endogenous inhibitor of DNA gyrase (YacG/DUF329 family)